MRYLDRLIDPDYTPLAWLEEHLADATEIHAVVGYLDWNGICLIKPALEKMLDAGGLVHLVADFRDGHPSQRDIARIVDFLSPYGERASLALVTDVALLHSKVFLIRDAGGGLHALVGSANLTSAGLGRNHESCLALEPVDGQPLEDIHTAVKGWREHPQARAVDLGMVKALARLDTPNPGGYSAALTELMDPALDAIASAAAQDSKMVGIPTGFTDLDRLLNGLQPGQLVVIAGRPSMGKSTLALDISRAATIRHLFPTLFMSFEMTSVEVMNRVLSAEARIPLHVLRSGTLTDDDWAKLARRMGEISTAPLIVNGTCTPTLRALVTEARRMRQERDVRLIVVDYLQQIQVDRRTENRQQEVAEISRTLKRLALELGVPVIAVSQLNRAPEARPDRRPVMSDLRESGGLEQDADIVILLHRDDYYDRESPRAGEADFIVAKHRNGATDTITTAAQLHLSRFVDMAVI